MPVRIEHLDYTYMAGTPFEHKALDDVSLEIDDGEFVGVIGHTGSGKSTLIQIMAGLVKVDPGHVFIDDVDIFAKKADKKWLRRTVGVVFQYPEYQLFEETIAKDISYGPKMTGVPEGDIEGRVRVAMELVGIDYDIYKDKSPFELSGGQKRKIAIAGVLAVEPKILIMDEPIAGLDPMGRESLMQLVRDLNDTGTTIIMISHNMDGLAEYAHRIIALKDSRIVLNGRAEDVFSQYDKVREVGLDLPEACRLAELMTKKGIYVPPMNIRMNDVLDSIADSIKRGEGR